MLSASDWCPFKEERKRHSYMETRRVKNKRGKMTINRSRREDFHVGRVKRSTCCLSLTGGHEFSDESPGNAHKAVLFHTQHMRYLSP